MPFTSLSTVADVAGKRVWLKTYLVSDFGKSWPATDIHCSCMCALCHFWPLETSPFLEVILGTHAGRFIYPSLCSELICSVLALIIYSECERRGVSAFLFVGLVFNRLLRPSCSVTFFLSNYFMWISHRSLAISSTPLLSLSVFFYLTPLLPLFHLLACCSDCPTAFEILCCCSLPGKREREIIFFHVCPTPIILPIETDGAHVRIHC